MKATWKSYNLGNVVLFKNGKSRPEKSGEYNVYGGNGILGTSSEFNSNGEVVVVGRVGAYCGSVYYENRPIWVSDNALYALPKNNYNTKYIFYLLKDLQLNRFAEGSSHPLLTQTLLNQIDVLITEDRKEQFEIASILSSLDDKIELNQQMNQTAEAIAQTLFHEWFLNFNFPGFDGELISGLPKGWKIGKLGEVLDLQYGKALKAETRIPGEFPVLGSSGIVDYHNAFIVVGPGIVIGRKGTIGEVIWVEENFFPIDTTFYVVDKIGTNGLYYHYFLLKEQDFKKIGSDSAVPGLNRNQAHENTIVVPEKNVVDKFNEVVKLLFEKKFILKNEIATLTRLRDSLLPKLMSGKIEIKA